MNNHDDAKTSSDETESLRQDRLFGKLLVERKLATPAQVKDALARQIALSVAGTPTRLGQILVNDDVISPEDVRAILREQGKMLMLCPSCNKLFNVRNYHQDKQVRCPSCKDILIVPGLDGLSQSVDASETTVFGPAGEESPEEEACSGKPFGTRYRLLEKLGEGGMGVVYKAWDTELKRLVALKRLRLATFDSEELKARFLREARLAARMRHPHIVRLYDIGRVRGEHYFTMDYVQGQTLEQYLADRPKARSRTSKLAYKNLRGELEWLASVAEGLAHAHEQGLVHRDLKPGNILIDENGTPFVADFGLAKQVEVEGKPSGQEGRKRARTLTISGNVLGTPAYMAPEQAEGRIHTICPATDVFALGIILYELLTARNPFLADTIGETLFRISTEDPVPPRRMNRHCPAELQTICLKALEKPLPRRYREAGGFARELRRYLGGQPIEARPPSLLYKLRKWAFRRKALVAVAGAALVLLVTVAAVLGGLLRSERTEKGALSEQLDNATGREREQQQQRDEAMQLVRQGREKYDQSVETLRAGQEAQALEELEEAAVLFEEAGQKDSSLYLPVLWLARCRRHQGKLRSAEEFLEVARHLGADDPQLDLEEGILVAIRWLDSAPIVPILRLGIGLEGGFEPEGIILERTIEGSSPQADAQRRRALELLSGALTQVSASPDAALGEVLLATMRFEQDELTEALDRIDEGFWSPGARHQLKAWLYLQKNECTKALGEFEAALALRDPSLSYAATIGAANAALALSETEKAIDYGREAAVLEPQKAGPQSVLAYAFLVEARFEEAARAADAALRQEPNSPGMHLIRALVSYALFRRMDDALEELEKEMTLASPMADQAASLRPMLMFLKGEKQEAAACAEQVCNRFPDSPQAWRTRLMLEANKGATRHLKELIREAVTRFPADYDVLLAAAWCSLATREFDHAIQYATRAIEAQKSLGVYSGALAFQARAFAHLAKGDLARAKAEVQRAITSNPRSASAHLSAGLLAWQEGERELAIRSMSRAIELKPTWPDLYHHRGMVYFQMAETEKAEKDFRRFVQLAPTRPEAIKLKNGLLAQIEARRRQGELDDAWVEEALRLEPKNALEYLLRAEAKMEHHQMADALEDLDACIELDPAIAQAYSDRAHCRVLLADIEGAFADTQRALELDPTLIEVYVVRFWGYKLQGKWKEAAAELEEYMRLDPAHERYPSMDRWLLDARQRDKRGDPPPSEEEIEQWRRFFGGGER